MAIAPYHVIITLCSLTDPAQKAIAEKLYEDLLAQGVEVILDDRDERPGVKFKDADLIGIPIRVTVGKKAAEGLVEYKLRAGGEMDVITPAEAVSRILEATERK